MPELTFYRKGGLVDRLRTYRIVVDGEVVGSIGAGETIRTEVPVGAHIVEAKIDWCAARPLHIEVDDDMRILVESNVQGWRMLLGVPTVFFRPRRYLRIQPEA